MMDHMDSDSPVTRLIEHKHSERKNPSSTWATWKSSEQYVAGEEDAYYLVNDSMNHSKYISCHSLTASLRSMWFGGLGRYRHYDMRNVIGITRGVVRRLERVF